MARTPDYPGLPSCTGPDGGYAELHEHGVAGSIVLFRRDGGRGPETIELADCTSGTALQARATDTSPGLVEAGQMLVVAMHEPAGHTFAGLATRLRAQGYAVGRDRLPAGHCICAAAGIG